MRISLIQTDIIWANRQANIHNTERVLTTLAGKTDLAVLPEMFTTGFCVDRMDLAETMTGETIQSLKKWASQWNMAITGSFIATENEHIYNRAFFVFPNGSIRTADKRHLFSMGKENEIFTSGNEKLVVNYKGFNIFILVCYDLRFPVWSRNVNNAYDMLIYVANFPHARVHVWDVLLQARALENQAYVCGVNRVGTDNMGLTYSGHSVLLNAKAEALASFQENESGTRTIDISLKKLSEFREKFAVWKDSDNFKIL